MGSSRRILLVLVSALALAGSGFLAAGWIWPFGEDIEQPIAFPHDVHAGELAIPCMYCHFSADRSPDAGIPPVSVCAGCHIPGGVPMVATENPEVQKLVEYWQSGERIEWVRIHDLPDHVHFPHMRHIKAGLECQQCHGRVETMEEIEQVASLEMGWCIDCHQERGARYDCAVCHY